MPLIIIYPYIFPSFYCHVCQSKTIQYLYSFQIAIFGFSSTRAIQRASNGKSSVHHIYKDEYSIDLAYAVIRLSKITARNEKGLTGRGTASKFLYGPKQILPGPGPGVATPLLVGVTSASGHWVLSVPVCVATGCCQWVLSLGVLIHTLNLCKVQSMDDNCGEWVECMGVASGCG